MWKRIDTYEAKFGLVIERKATDTHVWWTVRETDGIVETLLYMHEETR